MKTLQLPSGRSIPILGQGTWRMGEKASQQQTEIEALRLGIDLGMTLIDTAEMYGEGGAEKVVARAIAGCRDRVYLVSKFYPHHASYQGVLNACDRSLSRLKTDYLDLYLLHWRSSYPLSATLEALQYLQQSGKILDYGLSNFDTQELKEATALPGGEAIATNQVLYNLMRRGIEWDLLPWARARKLPIMAYSPLEQGAFVGHPQLQAMASARGVTPTQIALSWLLHQDNIISIPKSSSGDRLRENCAASDIALSAAELQQLDQLFPPPQRKQPLAMR